MLDKPLKPTAPTFTRIVAAAIDMLIVILVSVVGSFFVYRGIIQNSPSLSDKIENQTAHVLSSHLAKESGGSYYSYATTEYFDQTESGGYLIIDAFSHFYLNYMTNTNLNDGEVGSLEYEKELDINGNKVLPKDYYTITWFNENILMLPKEGQTATIDYFDYQKDGENIDYTKVGTVNEKYVSKVEKDGVITYQVDASKEMTSFVTKKYQEAIDILYKQESFKSWSDDLELASSLTTLISRLVMISIVFILIPMLLKDGKTLGKLLFKMSLSNIDDTPIKKWQILPRALTYLIIPVIMFFVTNSYINIAIIVVLLIGSVCLMSLTKRKTALHDIIARTIVVDDYYKKKLKEEEELSALSEEEPLPDEDVTFTDEKSTEEKVEE